MFRGRGRGHHFGDVEKFVVDVWAQQTNYADVANTDNLQQEKTMQKAFSTLTIFADKLVWDVGTGLMQVPLNILTFFSILYALTHAKVYDFKGVSVDLKARWPKLNAGAVFSGRDYVSKDDGPLQTGQDWS